MSNKQTSCVAIVDFLADVSELITPEVVAHFKNLGEDQALGILVHDLNILHDRVKVARVVAMRVS